MNTPYIPKYPHLTSPLTVGPLTLRSRVASAPIGFPDITKDGCITRDMAAFYELRAKGGASIVTVSEAMTHVTGRTHGRVIDLTNPNVLASLTNTARAIRRHGAVASIELNHGGRYASVLFDALRANSASTANNSTQANSEKNSPDDKVSSINEMTEEFIREVVASFAAGAALVKRAGFDMVMIHGGHGWLIEQFLSPAVNQRTDKYGGSFENRARLAVEIIDAVRRAVGRNFPIDFRMSAVENIPGGYDLDEAVAFAKLISPKIDLLNVSAGYGEENFALTHPPMFAPHGVNVKYAAEIRKNVVVPVAAVGALNDPQLMDEIIASGQADVLLLARALLADPELPRKAEQNRGDEIVRCLRCFTCHAERMLTQTRICAVNPVIGREFEAMSEPRRQWGSEDRRKRVLVAGGGPGGLSAALWAARRGHRVTLCEKRHELGGALLAEKGIDFKRASLDFIATLAMMCRRESVDIRLGAEVTPQLVRSVRPDALIVAVGAEPVLPQIPGINGENVISANDLPNKIDRVGKIVAVLGGGLVGCETAVHLKNMGRDVTIIEMGASLAPDANPRHRPILLRELAGVRRHTYTRAVGISKAGLRCVDVYGMELVIPATTIIVAAGQRPRREVTDSLRGLVAETSFVGDCVAARNIREAVWRGYHAALDL